MQDHMLLKGNQNQKFPSKCLFTQKIQFIGCCLNKRKNHLAALSARVSSVKAKSPHLVISKNQTGHMPPFNYKCTHVDLNMTSRNKRRYCKQ